MSPELSPERAAAAKAHREYIQALIARTIVHKAVELPSIVVRGKAL